MIDRRDNNTRELSSAALAVLTTRPACRPSLALCLSSHGESLPSVPDAYGQSLEALLSWPAASKSESYVPDVVSEREYPAVVAVSDVPGDGSRMHTHDHDGSKAPDGSPESILSSEPKPLGKHKPPHPSSILSPGESSYPP
ncbi:hypothetical protein Tco_1565187 [Tanacetum coccineum]